MPKKPHLIIFNPDQWRSDVMGHMGNPAAVTPNLDRLVQDEAVSFATAFCQNTVCTPSRCSFMTGWYPHVRGHRTMFHMLHPEHGEPNLLKTLKDNGYFVWWGGKNDLTPGQQDFAPYCDVKFKATDADFARWNCSRRESSHDGDLGWRGDPQGDNYYSFLKGKLDKGNDEVYGDSDWSHVLGALDLIRTYKGEKPLCIYLPISFPHPPYGVEEPFYSMIERDKLPPRPKRPEGLAGKPAILKGLEAGQGLTGWSEERWTELRAVYYGMCARLDHQFGLLMDALKETNRYDDSAVFLFSDHGDYTGDYGIVEKAQNTFEDCLARVPLIVKPPKALGVKPRVSQALVELVDFSATVFELTGIEPDYDSFGQSLIPLLKGETEEHRDAAFSEGGRLYGEVQATESEAYRPRGSNVALELYRPRLELQITDEQPYHTKAAMCRTKTHKYVRRLYEQDELYDLVKDPAEEHNVIDDPAYRDVLLALKERMLKWYMETCDVVPRQTDKR